MTASSFVGAGDGGVDEGEAFLVGGHVQEAADLVGLFEDVGGEVGAAEEDDAGAGPGLVFLDAEADAAGGLHVAEEFHGADEVGVGLADAAAGGGAVVDAVDGLDGEGEDEVGGVAGLEHGEDVLGVDGGDESAEEFLAGEGDVGDGGAVGVDGLSAGGDEVALDGAFAGGGAADGDAGLEGVAADDGGDVDEDGEVEVAELDDVEEGLLLPGVGDGGAVLEAVGGDGGGADVGAAAKEEEGEGEGDGAGRWWATGGHGGQGISTGGRGAIGLWSVWDARFVCGGVSRTLSCGYRWYRVASMV